MTSRLARPPLLALAVSLGAVMTTSVANAQAMDHSMHAPAAEQARASDSSGQSETSHGQMDHSSMDHGQMKPMDHDSMDHGSNSMDHGSMDHGRMNHGSVHNVDGIAGPPLIPALTNADREAAFPAIQGHTVHDKMPFAFLLFDQLEYQRADEGSALSWELLGWWGGDVNRLWLRSEGERTNGVTEDAEIQALWGHSIGPWWDVVAGVRQDFKPGSPQTWGALGIQGLALYGFEAEATAFIGEGGQTAARLEGEYDILLTNRLILQPTAEMNFYGKNDSARGAGSGLADTELGLRLRYEIVREFAPYIGVSWGRSYGDTADFARDEGEDIDEARFVAGVRMWF
ncbi:MAG TPA: copper resistance protein B [Pseudomonas xinjiangensis]|uniref:Copper resistance protein B n=2 Tax=Pseudomonadales TaxID=72274 RepID=A0A7V1BL99_9GAMM|nr:copper resistance protein B [Marinobacter antarcticus]HDZ55319.1 copper resistance protein B [Halopseudomonas xinjiangensis]HEA51707.1 copper resistance protein B [Marinobacter antarcticus]